ncbi:MAG: AI-2E family transporter [Pseudonocardiaceae bacterium]
MTTSPRRHNAADAVPYPLRVAASVSWRVLAVSGLFVVLGYLTIKLRVVVVPVAVALLLTALLGPVVNWMSQRRVPRGVATLVVVFSGLALVGGLLAFVIQAFVAGYSELRSEVVKSFREIRGWLQEAPFGLTADNVLDMVGGVLPGGGAGGTITSGAVSTAVSVGEFLGGAALALFVLIYFLYGGRSMWLYLLGLVPRQVRGRLDTAGQRAFGSLVGFVRATFLVAVVDAAGIGIGLLAVGAPLVVPLSALVFLSAFIPVIGAVTSGVIAVLVVLVAKGPVSALVVLGVVIGVQQLEGNVLQPLLLGRAVELNGLAVVLAVSVGWVTAGIAGALLAVPLLAVLNAGIRSLVKGDETPDDADEGTGSPTGGPRGFTRNRLRRSVDGRGRLKGSALPPADLPVDTEPDPQPDPLLGPLVRTEGELGEK